MEAIAFGVHCFFGLGTLLPEARTLFLRSPSWAILTLFFTPALHDDTRFSESNIMPESRLDSLGERPYDQTLDLLRELLISNLLRDVY